MVDELNCTQFSIPFPNPGTDEANNISLIRFIIFAVEHYRPYHYYLLSSLIVFSFFANILIVIVLSHKEMRHSGINVIMMFIAVSDFGCAVTGLMQLFIRNYSDQYMLFITAYLQLFVDYLAVVFHASSLFLAAGMALCRVMALNFSNRLKDKWQSPRYALRVTCAVYITVLTVSTLIVPVNEVKKTDDGEVYIDTSDFSLAYGCLLMKIVLVFVGICFKLIPCTLMLILSILLLQKMDEGKRSSVPINRNHKKDQLDRSSQLIQTILIVFLITEVPQGVFSIIGGIEVIDYLNYYQNLTIFMNVLSFFNTTTSFIIYSSLSAKFRRIFAQTFLPKNLLNMYMKQNTIAVASIARTSRPV